MTLVVIDPGHGVETAGKRSPDGTLREYEFNRDVSNRVSAYLESHGVKTKLTCTTANGLDPSNSVDLKKRVAYANTLKADYFVSIHANAYTDQWNSANGWEIYSYGLKGTGYNLAKAIQKQSIPYLGIRDRGIKDGSGFYVIKHTAMPAVLIEHAFYTNRTECDLLKSDSFREKCAIADAKGILAFLGIEWKCDKKASIYVNNKSVNFTSIEKDGVKYIPAKEMASVLNYEYKYDSTSDVIYLKTK